MEPNLTSIEPLAKSITELGILTVTAASFIVISFMAIRWIMKDLTECLHKISENAARTAEFLKLLLDKIDDIHDKVSKDGE